MNTSSRTLVGSIKASIGLDTRYTTLINVYVTPDGMAHVERKENGAVGGMDGPGGSTGFEITAQKTVKASGKAVVAAVKELMDDTIRQYGKPTKRFSWVGLEAKGLSTKLADQALALHTDFPEIPTCERCGDDTKVLSVQDPVAGKLALCKVCRHELDL